VVTCERTTQVPAVEPYDVLDIRGARAETHACTTLGKLLDKDYKPWCEVSHG
jgi:hypothetical protein